MRECVSIAGGVCFVVSICCLRVSLSGMSCELDCANGFSGGDENEDDDVMRG